MDWVDRASAGEGTSLSEADRFDRVLDSLHAAALDLARWPRAATLIDETLGTHGSTLMSGDGGLDEGYRTFFMLTCLDGERRRDLERLWLENYYRVDEGTPRVRRLPFNQIFHITDIYTEEELKSSAAYNALRTIGHAGNAIDVRLRGSNGSRILWQINDPLDGEGWSSAQLEAIRRLLPQIRQTVCVHQALSAAGALGASLEALLEATGMGVIQLDRHGSIVEVNDCARSLLRDGSGLLYEDGSLFARAPEDDSRLQEILARALPPFRAQGAGGSTMVRRRGHLLPLALHIIPVEQQETDFRFWPVAALVLVVDPAKGADIDSAVVAAALDLTDVESRVAVQLAHGMSVREIAAAAGRKESTIRTHVKHMFDKHGLSRQSDLVRLVLSLTGSPGSRR